VIGRRLLVGVALLAALLVIWGVSTLRPTSGGGRIVISLRGDLATTLDPANLKILVALEQRITSLPGVRKVSGPGTFIVQTAEQVDRAIRQDVAAGQARGALLVRYGYVGVPSIDNESFVGQLIFGSGTQPKPRFASLFPDGYHALVLVRPQAGLSDARMQALGTQIERLVKAAPLQGVSGSVVA
jgi:hypothetical protein